MRHIEKIRKPSRPAATGCMGYKQAFEKTAQGMGLALTRQKGSTYYFHDNTARTTRILKLNADGTLKGKPDDVMIKLYKAAQEHPALRPGG